jgi:hypothetical protein
MEGSVHREKSELDISLNVIASELPILFYTKNLNAIRLSILNQYKWFAFLKIEEMHPYEAHPRNNISRRRCRPSVCWLRKGISSHSY